MTSPAVAHEHAHGHERAERERLPVIRGREQAAPFSAKVDVVIVGSGAGGAVLARELARDGRSVLVLEEGGHYAPSEYGAMTPSNSFRRLSREAGMSVALGLGDTPLISLLAGKCVGGSSVLTGGVCFRIPEEVLHTWSSSLGLGRMTPEGLDPFFSEVEGICHVEDVPAHMRSRATELFVEGADKLGIPMKTMRRNTKGCRGAARCNFGCPNGAKMSVDVSFLPDAVAHGATVVSDALVERIDITGGVARGVRGRFLDGVTGEPRVRFEVRAKLVVVACGSMHTPILLRRSGLDSVHIGRHLTLHPAVRIGALFDEAVDGWDGALQSVYTDHFLGDGIWLNGVYSPVNVLAAAFPGVGREHRRLVKQMPNLAFFGGMVHDDGGGQVRRWISREPLVTYKMVKRDKARLLKTIHILGRMAFAAGAREVLTPIFGMATVKKEKDLEFLLEDKVAASKVECMAFHPLGSAKMATTADAGVVKPTGETWAVDNLFVCDGSILPTSIGVNSQLPIMSVAMMLARGIAADFERYSSRA
ncbi:MAG: GMC family oxidoreductase [Labilithrix sp.]|nr:GMC family oxidoreductase [Labilithrix sp.]